MPQIRIRIDYLRDNMSTDINEVVQRKFNGVIDEVDSILIDEAIPLIISVKLNPKKNIKKLLNYLSY